jgi:hypothetical protein
MDNRPMVDPPSREEIDAKIAASEARTDTKFAELLGEVKATNARLDHITGHLVEEKAGRRVTNSLIIGTGLAVIAAIVAVVSMSAAWFTNGIAVNDLAIIPFTNCTNI